MARTEKFFKTLAEAEAFYLGVDHLRDLYISSSETDLIETLSEPMAVTIDSEGDWEYRHMDLVNSCVYVAMWVVVIEDSSEETE
jgi:hypothetical protein